MKDYYSILGVPENGSEADIKKAFRKLAFEHHPDKNPGHEKQAEAKFKEINEAYGVLGDRARRQQYDFARRSGFGGAGQPGFGYSQQDIFNGIFANRAMYEEMSRMFSRAGLRFDQDFINRVFTSGVFYARPGVTGDRSSTARRPNWLERQFLRVLGWLARFVLKKLLAPRSYPPPRSVLDHHATLEITPSEAAAGGEKRINYQRDGKTKSLMVKIPSGVKTGTKIRLRGMGISAGEKSGDLYLHVKVREQPSSG